jgi:hypothetical protein
LVKLAIEGVGILRLSEHAVAPSIQKGSLRPLLQFGISLSDVKKAVASDPLK